MTFTLHNHVAELTDRYHVITHAQEFLEVLMNAPANQVIIHKENLTDSFFDLRSGVAGEMLQKVVNHRMQLAVVGDFSMLTSTSVRAFISESNRSGHVIFAASREEALRKFQRQLS